MEIDVWSDLACPWCFLGKHRLEAALSRLPELRATITWHAFELDRDAPNDDPDYVGRLVKKFGGPDSKILAMFDRVRTVAERDGLELRFDRIRAANTFDAHRLVRSALGTSVQSALTERLFRAHFTDGAAIADPDTLVRCAVDAGLDEAAAREVVTTDRFAAEVRGDEQRARELGITGVPCFVFDHRMAASGAQPVDVFVEVLREAAGAAGSSRT